MECPRCHNLKVSRFYKINNRYYCRNCISFSRVYVDDYSRLSLNRKNSHHVNYHLSFTLSKMQKDISQRLKSNYMNHLNSLVLAVCGSGKTEIVFETIAYALNQGDRVCFCTPRKELCKELYDRFTSHFTHLDVSLIYGGHIENLENQFIICTTHQLYRFEKKGFHLVVLDEADAFPFYNNKVLNEIFLRCVRGNYIKLSATFDKDDINSEELLIMNRRYHFHDLPLPYKRIMPVMIQRYYLVYFLWKMRKKKVLIFVPVIDDVDRITDFLMKFGFKVKGSHSQSSNNNKVLDDLKNDELDAIVCTTIFERGITISDVQVIVYKSHHPVFDSRTLIQIAGRVGRKPDAFDGHVCFLTAYNTKEINKCIYSIKKLNVSV